MILLLAIATSILHLASSNSLVILKTDGIRGPDPCAMTCVGTTGATDTGWFGNAGNIATYVQISECGFVDTPIITVSLAGTNGVQHMAGSAVYSATKDNFQIHLYGYIHTAWSQDTHRPDPAEAKRYQWKVNWSAFGFNC